MVTSLLKTARMKRADPRYANCDRLAPKTAQPSVDSLGQWLIGIADEVPIGLFIDVAQAPSREVETKAASNSFFMGKAPG